MVHIQGDSQLLRKSLSLNIEAETSVLMSIRFGHFVSQKFYNHSEFSNRWRLWRCMTVKKLRDVLQEREGASFNYFLTILNNFFSKSCSISVYLLYFFGLSWSISVHIDISRCIFVYVGLSPSISGHLSFLGLSRAISDYLGLSQTNLEFLRLSGTIPDYLGLSRTILNYLRSS